MFEVAASAIQIVEPMCVTYRADFRRGRWMGNQVAVKRLTKQSSFTQQDMLCLKEEVQQLRKLYHPNVAQILAVCLNPPQVSILTEFCSLGDLQEFLHDPNRDMDVMLALRFAFDTCKGMMYLHEQGVYHHNLKSRNLLLSDDFAIKITDYGFRDSVFNPYFPTQLSTLYDPQADGAAETNDPAAAETASVSGNRNSLQPPKLGPLQQPHHRRRIRKIHDVAWVAPEVLKVPDLPIEVWAPIDVYAFGIILFEIVTRELPYEDMNSMRLAMKILLEDVRPVIPEYVPDILSQLMAICWSSDIQERPTFQEILLVLNEYEQSMNDEEADPAFSEDAQQQSMDEQQMQIPADYQDGTSAAAMMDNNYDGNGVPHEHADMHHNVDEAFQFMHDHHPSAVGPLSKTQELFQQLHADHLHMAHPPPQMFYPEYQYPGLTMPMVGVPAFSVGRSVEVSPGMAAVMGPSQAQIEGGGEDMPTTTMAQPEAYPDIDGAFNFLMENDMIAAALGDTELFQQIRGGSPSAAQAQQISQPAFDEAGVGSGMIEASRAVVHVEAYPEMEAVVAEPVLQQRSPAAVFTSQMISVDSPMTTAAGIVHVESIPAMQAVVAQPVFQQQRPVVAQRVVEEARPVMAAICQVNGYVEMQAEVVEPSQNRLSRPDFAAPKVVEEARPIMAAIRQVDSFPEMQAMVIQPSQQQIQPQIVSDSRASSETESKSAIVTDPKQTEPTVASQKTPTSRRAAPAGSAPQSAAVGEAKEVGACAGLATNEGSGQDQKQKNNAAPPQKQPSAQTPSKTASGSASVKTTPTAGEAKVAGGAATGAGRKSPTTELSAKNGASGSRPAQKPLVTAKVITAPKVVSAVVGNTSSSKAPGTTGKGSIGATTASDPPASVRQLSEPVLPTPAAPATHTKIDEAQIDQAFSFLNEATFDLDVNNLLAEQQSEKPPEQKLPKQLEVVPGPPSPDVFGVANLSSSSSSSFAFPRFEAAQASKPQLGSQTQTRTAGSDSGPAGVTPPPPEKKDEVHPLVQQIAAMKLSATKPVATESGSGIQGSDLNAGIPDETNQPHPIEAAQSKGEALNGAGVVTTGETTQDGEDDPWSWMRQPEILQMQVKQSSGVKPDRQVGQGF
ncbi:hypothetical protein HK102_003072 [Quaeritorhiza haematococci]|nr:hypothetical protein HK102_003072 [Quaeritorhiza haematococci]